MISEVGRAGPWTGAPGRGGQPPDRALPQRLLLHILPLLLKGYFNKVSF